jgi:hypothetical protein
VKELRELRELKALKALLVAGPLVFDSVRLP